LKFVSYSSTSSSFSIVSIIWLDFNHVFFGFKYISPGIDIGGMIKLNLSKNVIASLGLPSNKSVFAQSLWASIQSVVGT